MRFEATLKKDKLKSVENVISLAVSVLKTRNTSHSVYLIYVAGNNEVRILIQSEEAYMVIVLFHELFFKIDSHSKDVNQNTTIGFLFKNGLKFLEELLYIIKSDTNSTSAVLQEENKLLMRLAKEKQFRCLQLKTKDKTERLEIERPTKNESELFSYEWLDGIPNGDVYFQSNTTHVLQFLKFVSKSKSSYPVQMLEEKVLTMDILLSENRIKLKLKAPMSMIEAAALITNIEGSKQKNYQYEIRVDDCEMLLLAVKNQSCFIIDNRNNMAIMFESEGMYNCQVRLNNWLTFRRCHQTVPEISYLKNEIN